MKKLFPCYIILFTLCFMLFIFEPIILYSSNVNDFWFDFSMMIFPLIKIFFISFLILCFIYTIIFLIFYKKLKFYKLYYFIIIISFIIFLTIYIQGNYLAGNLPGLNGDEIIWSDYSNDSLKSFALLLFICSVMIMLVIKFGYDKIIRGIKFICLAIFAMLSISLVSTILTSKTIFNNKNTFALTTKNINNASSDKNFYIFLVDAVDSRAFNSVLENSDLKDTFENFTYFPDTMSAYPFTRDSIPFILTGKINENKKEFSDYSTNAYDKSPLFENLKKTNYDINVYDNDITWNSDNFGMLSNVIDIKGEIDDISFYKQQIKYLLYKYLPFYLKKYSKIETMDFKNCKKSIEAEYYGWDDYSAYKNVNNDLNIIEDKYFNFTHIEGAHRPFKISEDLEPIENGTYDQKLIVCLKIINAFINRLKENNVYDNSVIIIMSDHGFNFENIELVEGRQNPILYIKGIDEHHEMYTSDKPISYFDLMDAYNDLLEDKKSDELFFDIEYPRTRRYIWYMWTKEDHMVEYEQDGKAWETDKMVKTGKEFDR